MMDFMLACGGYTQPVPSDLPDLDPAIKAGPEVGFQHKAICLSLGDVQKAIKDQTTACVGSGATLQIDICPSNSDLAASANGNLGRLVETVSPGGGGWRSFRSKRKAHLGRAQVGWINTCPPPAASVRTPLADHRIPR